MLGGAQMAGRGERKIFGGEAERVAAEYLVSRGYRIFARNFFCRYGELDVVAEKDGTICFVEVRMRSTATWGDPALTVSWKKQRRIVTAALHYLFQHDLSGRMMRFDVISVLGRGEQRQVEHIPAAFDAGI
jgi:putative endonuclease